MDSFDFLHVFFENFKQLFLGDLDVHSGWELHRIHHHLSNKNVYFEFIRFCMIFSPFLRIDTFPSIKSLKVPRSPKGVPNFKIFERAFSVCQVRFWARRAARMCVSETWGLRVHFVIFSVSDLILSPKAGRARRRRVLCTILYVVSARSVWVVQHFGAQKTAWLAEQCMPESNTGAGSIGARRWPRINVSNWISNLDFWLKC